MPTATRRLTLAAAFAAVLAAGLSGCGGDTCPTENPNLSGGAAGVPVCTGGTAVQAGATVTVSLRICPTCNQTADVCTVTLPQGDNIIQLDPLVQACTSSTSCPPACTLKPLGCTFTAPAAGNYNLLVNDPASGVVMQPFQVVADGGATTCTG